MNIGIAAPIEINSLKHHFKSLTTFDLTLGLGGTAVNNLINGLLNQGHKIWVFTLDPNVNEEYVLNGVNIKVYFGHFRLKSKIKWVDFCYHEYKQIHRFILREKDNLDIINAHWSYEFAIGTILSKVPHLITFRDHSQSILKQTNYHPYRFFRLLMDTWVRRHGQNFSFNSDYLKQKIIFTNRSFPVIPNPVSADIEFYSRKFPQKEIIKICFIANGWDRRKNPENALLAFIKLKLELPNIQLHMFGNNFEEDFPKVMSFKKKHKLESVYFHGKLAHKDLLKILPEYDLLLHTSREESFGNNIIEAMAVGMPVVAGRNAGAIPWILDKGKAGILTNIENSEEISEAIKKVLKSPEIYEKMSKNALEIVQAKYTEEVVTNRYLEEYERILNRNNESTSYF